MGLTLVVCYPDAEPHVYRSDKLEEPPDGCDGYMGIQNGPEGPRSLAIVPINSQRPEDEKLTDFLLAVTCAKTYLSYGKVFGAQEAGLKPSDMELFFQMFTMHIESVAETAAQQAVLMGVDLAVITQVCRSGFLTVHDKCCSDPVCKIDMHKRIFGTSKVS